MSHDDAQLNEHADSIKVTVSVSSVVAVTLLNDRASRIATAVSLLNSSVGISRSALGDDAYVTDNIVTAVFSLCFWPLVAILIEIGYSAGRSGIKSPVMGL